VYPSRKLAHKQAFPSHTLWIARMHMSKRCLLQADLCV
jgi:hypothetical protein